MGVNMLMRAVPVIFVIWEVCRARSA